MKTYAVAPPLLLCLGAAGTAGCMPSELGNVSSKRQILISEPVPKAPFDADQRAACGEGGITESGASAFLRYPYLQRVQSDSARILWTTDLPEAMTVRVTTAEGEEVARLSAVVDEQSNRSAFDQYYVAIEDLEPSTIYCYSISGESGEWLSPTGFRTAPPTGSDATVRIAVVGDLGTQTSDQLTIRDQLMEVAYDLVLVNGDLAYEKGTLSDHERNFFEVYRDLMRSVPFYVISGNHDYASDGAVFREVFALPENGGPEGLERWYSFDWGSVHIVGLDTERVNDTQAAWLDADLAATEQPWRIAFMHRPAFSSGSHGSTAKVQQHFVPSLRDYGVDLVLAGHDHNYERTDPIDGVTYAVIGSSGRGTRPVGKSAFTAYSESVAHFGHITIEGDALRLNAVDALGADFDSVTLAQ